MYKKIFTIMSLALLLTLPGCFSFSAHQTAEVVPKGSIEWGEGFGYYRFDYTSDCASINKDGECVKGESSFGFPYFPETIFRFGISDNMDAGIKLTGLLGGIEGDIKFQLLQIGDKTSNFTLSVQPAVGSVYLGVLSLYKFSGAVLASKRINSSVVVYGTFKYNYLNSETEHTTGDDSNSVSFDGSYYTGTLGVSLEGKRWWVRPEVTWTLDKKFNTYFYLPALGFGLRF